MLIKVLAPAYYSRKDVRTPVRIAVIAMFTNMLLNIALVVPMVMLGIPGPHAGLALATSLAAWVNASLLYRTLGKQQVFAPQAGWPRLWLQLALAGTALTGLLLWGVPPIESWLQWSAGERAWRLVVWVLAGAAAYLLALRMVGVRLTSLWHYGQHGG
jgi:putative peptidoglycan lipid II flippase